LPQPHGIGHEAVDLTVDVVDSDEVDGVAADQCARDAPRKWYLWRGGRSDIFLARAAMS